MRAGLQLKPRDAKENPVRALTLALVVMYVASGLLLLLLALLLYKLQLDAQTVKIAVIVIYIVTGVTGGMLMGKKLKSKKFLWGFAAGALYFLLLFCVSLAVRRGVPADWVKTATTFLLCACSGMAGGMAAG